MNIWVVSDTHFSHANIIKYAGRPFENIEEMNETMVDRWNSVVKDEDIIWHLGDVYFKNPEIISRLKGRKNLLLGNHDSGKDQNLLQNFQKIELWKSFPDFGIVMTHIPLHPSCLIKNDGTKVLNVHGHIHEKDSPEGNYRNVCVEKTNFTPINLEELRYKE